jgi:hypothetical protein
MARVRLPVGQYFPRASTPTPIKCLEADMKKLAAARLRPGQTKSDLLSSLLWRDVNSGRRIELWIPPDYPRNRDAGVEAVAVNTQRIVFFIFR